MEKGTAQTKEVTDRMVAATESAGDLIKNALQATQDYNAKVLQFSIANCNATCDYFRKLSGVRAPSEFIELTTNHAREQSDVLGVQAKELGEFAQKVLPRVGGMKGFS